MLPSGPVAAATGRVRAPIIGTVSWYSNRPVSGFHLAADDVRARACAVGDEGQLVTVAGLRRRRVEEGRRAGGVRAGARLGQQAAQAGPRARASPGTEGCSMTPGPSSPGCVTRQKPPLWSETQVRPFGSTSEPVEMCRPSAKSDEPLCDGGPAPQPGGSAGGSVGSTL